MAEGGKGESNQLPIHQPVGQAVNQASAHKQSNNQAAAGNRRVSQTNRVRQQIEDEILGGGRGADGTGRTGSFNKLEDEVEQLRRQLEQVDGGGYE